MMGAQSTHLVNHGSARGRVRQRLEQQVEPLPEPLERLLVRAAAAVLQRVAPGGLEDIRGAPTRLRAAVRWSRIAGVAPGGAAK